jgi:glycine cleavage system H protein
MRIPEGYYYSKDHEWVKVEGNLARIGITDYAQDTLGDVVYVELPDPIVISSRRCFWSRRIG